MYSFVKKQKHFIAFGALFIFLFAAFVLSPLTVDDTYYKYLNMGSFKEIFNFAAGYGNGRVLGNMGGIFFARFPLAGAFVRSLISTGILALIYNLTKTGKEKTDTAILLVELLTFVCVNATFFGDTFAWQSAFFNAVPPLFLLFLNIAIIKKYHQSSKHKVPMLLLIAVFAFMAQFFSENSTINSCIFYLLIIITNGVHLKKSQSPYVVGLISSVIGAVAMVAVRRYYPLVERDFMPVKEYQGINIGGFFGTADYVLERCRQIATELNGFLVLFLILSIEMFVILSKNDFKSQKLNKFKPVLKFFCLFINAHAIVKPFMQAEGFPTPAVEHIHSVAVTIAYIMYAFAIVATCALIKNKKAKFAFIFAMLFAFCNLIPVTVVSPWAIRLLIYTYFFVMISELILLREIAEYIPLKHMKKLCATALCVVLVVSAYILTIYGNCFAMQRSLEKVCRYQIADGASEIKVCKISELEYFHAYPINDTYKYEFYRNKPGDVKFKTIESDEFDDLKRQVDILEEYKAR